MRPSEPGVPGSSTSASRSGYTVTARSRKSPTVSGTFMSSGPLSDRVAPNGSVVEVAGTALLTDYYELTMLQAALRSGVAHHRSVFEVSARRLPAGRRYAVACGLGRLIDALPDFRFGAAELDYLHDNRLVDEPTLDWLAAYRFSGMIAAYAEGEVFFPGSPIVTVEGPFAEAVLLETLVLSILNHDS